MKLNVLDLVDKGDIIMHYKSTSVKLSFMDYKKTEFQLGLPAIVIDFLFFCLWYGS